MGWITLSALIFTDLIRGACGPQTLTIFRSGAPNRYVFLCLLSQRCLRSNLRDGCTGLRLGYPIKYYITPLTSPQLGYINSSLKLRQLKSSVVLLSRHGFCCWKICNAVPHSVYTNICNQLRRLLPLWDWNGNCPWPFPEMISVRPFFWAALIIHAKGLSGIIRAVKIRADMVN